MQSPEALDPATITQIQQGFLEALPRIMCVARFRLRHLAEEQKQEAVAEVVALSWKAYRDLFLKGRNVDPLVQKIAEFSARRVRSGRRLAGPPKLRDALSPAARHRHGFDLESIPLSEEEDADPDVIDALQDRRNPSPADEAVLRMDYNAWLAVLDDRRRQIAEDLGSGRNTVEVAKLHGVSRARISQLREDLIGSWDHYHAGSGS